MSITFHCACGKALSVPDEHAGKRKRCPACRTEVTVPAADGGDDFEVLADEPEPTPAAAAKPADPPKKAKKKRKKKSEDVEETAQERLERVRAAEARVLAKIRAIAFIVFGAAIVIGVVIMFTVYRDAMKELGPRTSFGAILIGVMGVAAIGKGLIGLVFGQFLGEE